MKETNPEYYIYVYTYIPEYRHAFFLRANRNKPIRFDKCLRPNPVIGYRRHAPPRLHGDKLTRSYSTILTYLWPVIRSYAA